VTSRIQQAVDGSGVEVGGNTRIVFERGCECGALAPGGVVDDLVRGLPADGLAQPEHDRLGADHAVGQGEIGPHPGRVHLQP
jgi:hypothetical protein